MSKTIFNYIPYSEIKREKKRQEFREKYGDWMYGDWQTAVCNLLQHRQLEEAQERVKELEAALREINTRMYSNDYGDLYVCFDENLLAKLDALLAAERPEVE